MSHGQLMIPVAFYGVIAAGGVYSAASPSSTVSELARQITIGKSNLVICSEEHVEVAKAAAEQSGVALERVLVLSSEPRRLEGLGDGVNALSKSCLGWRRITDRRALKDSLITILWSSGTTGLPKGVMLSHENLVAETYITALSGRSWAEAEVAKGKKLVAREAINEY
jgi:4-coumarate--CoA ligase